MIRSNSHSVCLARFQPSRTLKPIHLHPTPRSPGGNLRVCLRKAPVQSQHIQVKHNTNFLILLNWSLRIYDPKVSHRKSLHLFSAKGQKTHGAIIGVPRNSVFPLVSSKDPFRGDSCCESPCPKNKDRNVACPTACFVIFRKKIPAVIYFYSSGPPKTGQALYNIIVHKW